MTTTTAMTTRATTRAAAAKWRGRLLYVGVAAVVAYCLAPFYWMLVSSLRRTSDIFDTSLVPSPVSFENYRSLFGASQGFTRALLNSLVVAGTTTVLALALATFTAYAVLLFLYVFLIALAFVRLLGADLVGGTGTGGGRRSGRRFVFARRAEVTA